VRIIPDYAILKGRLAYVYRDGWRLGRIVSVQAGKRIGLRKLRLAASRYEGNKRFSWNGPRYSVDGRTALAPGAGIYYRRRVVPLDEFVKRHCGKA
jgi:hypothetical protein